MILARVLPGDCREVRMKRTVQFPPPPPPAPAAAADGRDTCTFRKSPSEKMGTNWKNDVTLVLVSVTPGSAAARGGVGAFVGRRLTHVNDAPVQTAAEVRRAAGACAAMELRFSASADPSAPPRRRLAAPLAAPGAEPPAGDDLPARACGLELDQSLTVTAVTPGTPADRAGVEVGWQVWEVDGRRVATRQAWATSCRVAGLAAAHPGAAAAPSLSVVFAVRAGDGADSVVASERTACAGTAWQQRHTEVVARCGALCAPFLRVQYTFGPL